MKDNIIVVLWIIYSLGFGTLTIIYAGQEDKLEAFGLGCLAAQILLGIYVLLVMLINAGTSKIKHRFKIPAPKRFKNKVTPIYKLYIRKGVKNSFYICKYQLAWIDFDAGSYRFYLLPFVTLFQRYKYITVNYYEFEMDLDKIEDIGLLWEEEYAKRTKKGLEKKSAAQKKTDIVNKLNKVFLENYEE